MRQIAKRQKQPRFKAPEYSPYSNDYVIWELNESQIRDVIGVWGEKKAWVVAEEFGLPAALFWTWFDAVIYVAGKQIIEREGKVVWYVSPEAWERAQEETDADAESQFMFAQWMPYFHEMHVPTWFHRFIPRIPTPIDETRENPSRPRRARTLVKKPACRVRLRPNPRRAPDEEESDEDYGEGSGESEYGDFGRCDTEDMFKNVPPGVYTMVELKPCYCGGEMCQEEGPRISIFFNEAPIAQFGFGRVELDQDALWEEASLFVAAHQLFTRNIRPVWVRPLVWPVAPPMPPFDTAEYQEWRERAEDKEWSFPTGEYPVFLYDGFHVTYYPYEIGAALELPAPPPPPGQLPPPEPTILVERKARKVRQRAALASQVQAGAFGPGMMQAQGALPGKRG